eukprot:gene41604-65718_t
MDSAPRKYASCTEPGGIKDLNAPGVAASAAPAARANQGQPKAQ